MDATKRMRIHRRIFVKPPMIVFSLGSTVLIFGFSFFFFAMTSAFMLQK
mgnify:CR=1 FL=1